MFLLLALRCLRGLITGASFHPTDWLSLGASGVSRPARPSWNLCSGEWRAPLVPPSPEFGPALLQAPRRGSRVGWGVRAGEQRVPSPPPSLASASPASRHLPHWPVVKTFGEAWRPSQGPSPGSRSATSPCAALGWGSWSLAHNVCLWLRGVHFSLSPSPSFPLGPKRRPRIHWRKGPFRSSGPAWSPWTPWPPGKTLHLAAQPGGKGQWALSVACSPALLGSPGKGRHLAQTMAAWRLCLRITSYLERRTSCTSQHWADHTADRCFQPCTAVQIPPLGVGQGRLAPVPPPPPPQGSLLVTTENL